MPLDASSIGKLQELVLANGYLPPKQTLRELLHPQYRDDIDAAVTASGVDPVAAVA